MLRFITLTALSKNLRFIGLAIVFFLAHTSLLQAATLQITPSTGSYSSGQTFTTTIRVAPAGKNVNAVEATLKFDPNLLSVVSVGKTGSAFSLWTVEPTFSNTAGTVTFGGGSPAPFSATSNLITVTFRAVKEGSASVAFNKASVLAADGLGTDIYEVSPSGAFTIAAATTPTTPTPPKPTPVEETPKPTPTEEEAGSSNEEALIFGDPPRAPEVGSTSFLDPETWYSATDGIFTWTLPFDVDGMALEIATSSKNEPSKNKTAIIDPPVEEFRINKDIINDGVQYLSIQFKNQVGWGATLNRKLLIDTTPPEPFTLEIVTGTTPSTFPLLKFKANDVTSGVEKFIVTIADKEPFEITPDEAEIGYLLGDLEDGTYTVKVVAIDKAGNKRESTKPVLITAGWIKPIEIAEEKSVFDYLTAGNLFIFFLIVIIFFQSIYIWYERKQIKIKEEKLRRETREVQDQMEKIFSALRDEIYDQVDMISKRKRLSKSEKEAVEGLNQALEVSETLIEKEINDVKAILK